MNKLIKIFKALSDKNRLRVIAALIEHKELCACQLTELMQVTGATASRHLGTLLATGLIKSRKDGRWVYYCLNKEKVSCSQLLEWIKSEFDNDPDIAEDRERLVEIISNKPEDLCRKQRGEQCCPSKDK